MSASEQDFPEVPTLIYDGPFSESARSAKPKALEGKAGVDIGVIVYPPQDIGVDHPGAEDFNPSFAAAHPTPFTLTDETVDGHLDARFDEREIVASEPHLPVEPE